LIPSFRQQFYIGRTEQRFIGGFLALIAVLTSVDVWEDIQQGAPLSHVIPEVAIIVASVGFVLFFLWSAFKLREDHLLLTKQELSQARVAAASWQKQVEALKLGIADAISAQFVEWGLTPAEQEVAFLLIKGFSIAEIAQARSTSERTVRQQASEVYGKSRLSGRAQLAAFFLEDLFSPSEIIDSGMPQ
jgi:DNA-binding CsgD family transcriptional regulator